MGDRRFAGRGPDETETRDLQRTAVLDEVVLVTACPMLHERNYNMSVITPQHG